MQKVQRWRQQGVISKSDELHHSRVAADRAPARHRASIACADLGDSRKSNACTGAIGETETKTNNQAQSRKREFGKFDKAIQVFTAAEESDKSSAQRIRWNMGWNGKPGGSVGNIQSTQVISGSGTVVRSTSKLGVFTWDATCDGKTMRWSVETKYGSGVRSLTPKPDGKTALMTFESGAFHSSATFHKTST